ncbi:MAG: hypothetical protein FWD59_08145 [Micrococcales bacterium]|nr:hypothetical protein [Micrococcales bacterium]
MVSETLWAQVAALPPEDKAQLLERVEASLDAPPEEVLPRRTDEELRTLIDRDEALIDENPSLAVGTHGMLSELIASFS